MDRIFSILYALLSCCSFALSAVFYWNERQQTLGFLFVIFYIVLGILLAIVSYTKAKKSFSIPYDEEENELTEDPQTFNTISETHDFRNPNESRVKSDPLKEDLKELSVPLTFHSTVERVSELEKHYHYAVEKIIRETCTTYQVNYHKVANQGIHAMLAMYDELKGNFFTDKTRLELVQKKKPSMMLTEDIQVFVFDRPVGFLSDKHTKFLLPYLKRNEKMETKIRLIGGPTKNYDPKRQMMSYQYSDFQIELITKIKHL